MPSTEEGERRAGQNDDDVALVAAAQAGHLQAFELLVRRHQDRVFRLCLRMLGDWADAEDAAQDVFVRAWRSLGRFRGEAAFSTWLHRLAVNRCLDGARARRRTEVLDESVPDPSGQPEEVVEARRQLDCLEDAVAGLTPDQRVTFILREVEGLTYQDIAASLGIGLGAVKSRLNRARVALVTAMDDC